MKEERKLSRHPVAAVATAGLSMSVAENLLDMKHTLNPLSQLDLNKELVWACLSVCLSLFLPDVEYQDEISFAYAVHSPCQQFQHILRP